MDKDISLLWETFSFHTSDLGSLESEHLENVKIFNELLKEDSPSPSKRIVLSREINDCGDRMFRSYTKQLSIISELIAFYKTDKPVPDGMEVSVQYLLELKNITATLLEEMRVHIRELNEVLG